MGQRPLHVKQMQTGETKQNIWAKLLETKAEMQYMADVGKAWSELK